MTLTVTDDDGGTGTASKTITVTNVAPTASLSGSASANEGASYTLGFSATDPANVALSSWTINWGDGTAAQTLAGTATSAAHTYADNGAYTITVTATDKDGGAGSATRAVAVANVAPTLSLSGADSVGEGMIYFLGLAKSDPGADTVSAWTVNWGDGSAVQTLAGTATSASHTWADNGTYTVTVGATDEDGTWSTTKSVAVSNIAPTLNISGPAAVVTGTTYTLSLSASDLGGDTIASWTIDWGDGAVEVVAGHPASAPHTYAADGAYTITASAADEDGTYAAAGSVAITASAVVDTTPPATALGTLAGVTAGQTDYTFTVSLADDVDIDDATVDSADVLVSAPNGFSQLATLVSDAPGSSAGQRVATYKFAAPGGKWSFAANGAYSFSLQDDQVADTSRNFAPAAVLGSLNVRLAVPDLGGNTMDAAASIGIVGPGYAQTYNDYVSKGDRVDYFKLRIKQQNQVTAKMYGLTDDANIDLVDANGVVLQSAARAGTQTEYLIRTLTPGYYYYRVTYAGTGSTAYWLRVSSGTAATSEPGSTLATAASLGALAPGSTLQRKDGLSPADTTDYYKLTFGSAATLIGVASTKAFTCQCVTLTMLALYMGRRRFMSPSQSQETIDGLCAIPEQMEQVLRQSEQIREIARRFCERENWLFLGRGYHYPIALEGALKLKEISYIHAEGMPAAEMKHGPIALINDGMPVVFIATKGLQYDKVISNIEEVRARAGRSSPWPPRGTPGSGGTATTWCTCRTRWRGCSRC